jgi:uncharacterized protein with HEPN domain
MDDSKTKFASIKQLEIIGEAANHISDHTKTQNSHPEYNSGNLLSTATNILYMKRFTCGFNNQVMVTT